MNEKEIQERMNEIKEEIKSRQEDLNDIITPGAYFYDTEEAQRLQDEIDQLQEEYSKLENTPTAEKVEELIKLFEERIKQLREEEKDFYGSYYLTDEMQELVNEDGELTEKVEQYKKVLDLFKGIEKVTKEIEDLDEEIQEYAGKFDENDGKPVAGANFIPDELLNEQKQKEEELERLKKELEELLETLGIEEDIDKYITHPQEKQDKNEPEPDEKDDKENLNQTVPDEKDDKEDPDQPEPDEKDDKEDPDQPEPDEKDDKEDPNQTVPDEKDDKEDPDHSQPGKEEPGQLADVNSGLQQFRKQMNIIRDNYPIENKHTITERMALPQTLVGVGSAGLMAFAALNPLIGIGIIGASVASKPLMRMITGQNKIEDQITDQLRDMALNDKANFDLMVDYLTEEKIQDLKPNAVFLNALHRVMVEQTADVRRGLDERMNILRDERDQLLQTSSSRDLNANEIDRLNAINTEIDRIENVEAPEAEKRYKDCKRGKDRVSQRYKGNLATRFNIFAHRNTNSEEYDKPINDLADAEKAKLIADRDGEVEISAAEKAKMEEVMRTNTSRGFLGIQNSVFNDRNSTVRCMSDVVDNTIKHIGMVATAGIGLTATALKLNEFARAQDANAAEHTRVVDIANNQGKTIADIKNKVNGFSTKSPLTQDTVQKAADGKISEAAAFGETSAMRSDIISDGGVHGTTYYNNDQAVQDLLGKMKADGRIGAGTEESMLRSLADITEKEAHGVAKDFGQSLNGVNPVNDHTVQQSFIENIEAQKAAEANIFRNLADAYKVFGDIGTSIKNVPASVANNFQMVKQSFIGPAISAMATALGIGKDISKNHHERNPEELNNGR